MANILKGLLYKKTLDADGNVTSKVPFLPRTLSKLVIMDNGTDVETTIGAVKTDLQLLQDAVSGGGAFKTFATKAAYDAAVLAGEVKSTDLCIIKEG